MAHEILREAHDAVGHAAVEHQLPRENEERDREEGEDVHPRGHALKHHRERQPFPQDGAHRREPDRKGDRHSEQEEEDEADREDGQCHDGTTSSPRSSAMMCSIEKSTMSAPEITSGAWLNASERPSVGILYGATEAARIAPFQAMIAPKAATSAWITSSMRLRMRSGTSTSSDSMPICPASRRPTAAPSSVT